MTRRIRFTSRLCTGAFACAVAATPSPAVAADVPFVLQAPLAAGLTSESLALVDLDGDGDVDGLAAQQSPDGIVWYDNAAGDGSAWTTRTIATSTYGPVFVATADLDGDGDPDVLATGINDPTIRWYENDGQGGAWVDHVVAVPSTPAYELSSGDVDGDGDLDLMAAGLRTGGFAWYENVLGNGSTWATHTASTAGSLVVSLRAVDIDRDGDLDALSVSPLAPNDLVAWYENVSGDGGVWTLRTIATGLGLNGLSAVDAVDVDGDGDVDAVIAGNAPAVVWAENAGGSGGAWIVHTVTTLPEFPTSLVAADVDADGDRDVVLATLFPGPLFWFENSGNGGTWTPHTPPAGSGFGTALAAGDVDGDGDLDLLAALQPSASAYSINWLRNDTIHGSACFVSPPLISTTAAAAYSVTAADIDRDGDLDPLSASPDDDKVAWYENVAGNGSAWALRTISTVPNGALSVHTADVDGDGDQDALSASVTDDLIAWHENLAGNGTAWALRTISTAADVAASVFAGDVDGDGDVDALSASVLDDTIAWYENTAGNGTAWTLRTISLTTDGAVAVSAADLDSDGDLDVLAAAIAGTVTWFENTAGNGTAWTVRTISTTAPGAVSVDAADVDGDGDLDVLSASYYDDKVAWYENVAGNGTTWTLRTISTAGDAAQAVRAVDFDGDGDVDVLSSSLYDDTVAWHENTAGNGSAWTRHVIATNADWPASIAAADLDGDGDRDALSAARNSDQIAWYRNDRGQFALAISDLAPPGAMNGDLVPMLGVVVTHGGRAGDGDLEVTRFGLLFEEAAGDALTTAEANALIESLRVYRDVNGNGLFEPGTDVLVASIPTLALTAGVQMVNFTDGDPSVQVAHGSPRRYFVVTEITGNASTQTPNRFRITHLGVGPSASLAEDRAYDIPLRPACPADVPSSVLAPTPVELMDFRIE